MKIVLVSKCVMFLRIKKARVLENVKIIFKGVNFMWEMIDDINFM